MNNYSYVRAKTVAEAVREMAGDPTVRVIAGGTNLVDLMKYDVERPTRLVDITRLPLDGIEDAHDGGLTIGALALNADVAWHPRVEQDYPLLASAILAGASPQLRNAATTAGNLMQRTRCYYFYDTATACNKREPGSGCSALGGVNRIHAILGTSDSCIATHPSDMCVGMAALDAKIHVTGPDGDRTILFEDFHRLPGDRPEIDNTLEHGEIVTAVTLPVAEFSTNYTYLKLRDRLSYAFALVSVAVGLRIDGDTIADARIALGGVAHKPWRDRDAEALLLGRPASREAFQTAADHILADAKGRGANDFKVELAHRAIMRALRQAAAGTPQVQSVKRVN